MRQGTSKSENDFKLCSISNDSVPALGVNDENMLRRYVYMFRTSFFSDHKYPFSFFYTLLVLVHYGQDGMRESVVMVLD